MTTEVIALAEANIRSVPMLPLHAANADINRLFGIEGVDIVTGAEIVPFFRPLWRHAAKKAGKKTYGSRCEDPISVTDRYTVHFSAVEFLTKGVAHITPNRYQTRVRLSTARDFKVAVLAKHTVSQWQRYRWRPLVDALRRRIGLDDQRLTRRRVRKLVEKGYTVLISGDLNSMTVVDYHPDQINIANVGLMQLTVVPAAGITVKPLMTKAIRKGLHTDHPFVVNHVQLRRDE